MSQSVKVKDVLKELLALFSISFNQLTHSTHVEFIKHTGAMFTERDADDYVFRLHVVNEELSVTPKNGLCIPVKLDIVEANGKFSLKLIGPFLIEDKANPKVPLIDIKKLMANIPKSTTPVVFWLSRHKMTPSQGLSLSDLLDSDFQEVVINPVYPAHSEELEAYIDAVIGNEPAGTIIAGSFPGPTAIRMTSICKARGWKLLLPVSVPATVNAHYPPIPSPQPSRQVNGFAHSHWEEF